jgi:hypothetical protein
MSSKNRSKRRRNPVPIYLPPTGDLAEPMRFAVVNATHQEILSANHRNIGEAFNSMNEDYVGNVALLVVGHRSAGEIIGAVDHRGNLRKTSKTYPATIWDGAKHPFYEPQTTMFIGKLPKTEAEVQAEVMEIVEACRKDFDEEMLSNEINKRFIEALDAREKSNASTS